MKSTITKKTNAHARPPKRTQAQAAAWLAGFNAASDARVGSRRTPEEAAEWLAGFVNGWEMMSDAQAANVWAETRAEEVELPSIPAPPQSTVSEREGSIPPESTTRVASEAP